ncbi:hypothetical protein AAG906_030016 [Vitis piasezkii]
MQKLGDFKLPNFFNYPPYFTLEEEFSLFLNPVIERTLSHEAREALLSALVLEGVCCFNLTRCAEWMDKGHKKCLILWHRIQDWADIILHFVRDNGLEDSVMTGNALHGMESTVLMRALEQLEHKGKACSLQLMMKA